MGLVPLAVREGAPGFLLEIETALSGFDRRGVAFMRLPELGDGKQADSPDAFIAAGQHQEIPLQASPETPVGNQGFDRGFPAEVFVRPFFCANCVGKIRAAIPTNI